MLRWDSTDLYLSLRPLVSIAVISLIFERNLSRMDLRGIRLIKFVAISKG
jgi:hypothetical protein